MATTGAQLDEVAARRRIIPADLNGGPAVVITDSEDRKKELLIVRSRMEKIIAPFTVKSMLTNDRNKVGVSASRLY